MQYLLLKAFQDSIAKYSQQLKPNSSEKISKVYVTFTGLTKEDVQQAAKRLNSDLNHLLVKEDWSHSPQRSGIQHLSEQQV